MRRLTTLLVTLLILLLTALPTLAQEGDPLANALLLPGVVGWVMAGLALALFLLFLLWSARGPR